MKRVKLLFALIIANALFISLASSGRAQIDIGPATISGSIEADGLPRSFSGSKAKFEEYRDIPETVVVPQLDLFIDSKKNDFYIEFGSIKPGLDDQNFKLRAGRYGLIDMEFEWDQFPHLFNVDTAKTPFRSSNDGGTLTLGNKPNGTVDPVTARLGNPASPVFPPTQGTPSTTTCIDNPFCRWLNKLNADPALNSDLHPIDLSMMNRIARFKLRYTPSPGWTFTGNYWSNNNVGKRALGSYIGTSPGSYNIVEIPEPIDYQTHNIELGGEYAASWWTLGLKYNASLFHNSVSTLVYDNPANIDPRCADGSSGDSKLYTVSGTTGALTAPGPCRARIDLYPSNQAHTFTLTGTAKLPLKTQFLSTVSYGWRLQDDAFLPYTINSAIKICSKAESADPQGNLCLKPIGRDLGGDVRPLMVNASFVNNFFEGLNLKAYYRLYDLNNRSNRFTLAQGFPINDTGSANCTSTSTASLSTCTDPGSEARSFIQYSKNTLGFDAAYNVTRWLTAKLSYGWDRMHRTERHITNSDESGFGPTLDIKPWSWLLVRASYRHFWRSSPDYEDEDDIANINRMFDLAARQRDRVSLYTQVSPWDMLTFHGGFEFTNDRYTHVTLGLQNDINYSPSVGLVYSPLDWVRLFADYNWDRFDWLLRSMQRANSAQDPGFLCLSSVPADQNDCLRVWNSRGREKIHTISLGTDLDLIKNLLGARIQYGFSYARSDVRGSGATCLSTAGLPFPASGACTPATDYAPITNMWHELLMRLQYQVHKNVALNVGYYFNHYNSKDVGVDIMKQWMGDQDQWSITGNANLGRSIFLGDQLKGPYTAHVGLIGLKLRF